MSVVSQLNQDTTQLKNLIQPLKGDIPHVFNFTKAHSTDSTSYIISGKGKCAVNSFILIDRQKLAVFKGCKMRIVPSRLNSAFVISVVPLTMTQTVCSDLISIVIDKKSGVMKEESINN